MALQRQIKWKQLTNISTRKSEMRTVYLLRIDIKVSFWNLKNFTQYDCPLKKVRRSNSQNNDYNLQNDKKCSNKSVSKNDTRSVFNNSTPLFVMFLKGMGIMAFRIFLCHFQQYSFFYEPLFNFLTLGYPFAGIT